MPAQKGGRIRAQIHGHIEHLTAQTCDNLRLGVGRILKVQAANDAPALGDGMIDLRDRFGEPDLPECFVAEEPGKESSSVGNGRALYDRQSRKEGGPELEAVHRLNTWQ